MKLTDPTNCFEDSHCPAYLDASEQAQVTKMKKWELQYKLFLEREEVPNKNIFKIYCLIIGHCTPVLKSCLKGYPKFDNKSIIFDALWLIRKVKKTVQV